MILSIVLLSLVGLIPADAIHRQMTPEERFNIFNTYDVNDVPVYDVVSPIIKRNTRAASVEVQLKAFGDDVNLFLNPTEGILAGYDTPVWEIQKGYPKPKLTRVTDAFLKLKSRLLEDAKKGATVVATENPDKTVNIRGVSLANGLEIHPVPSTIKPIRPRTRIGRSLNEISDESNNNQNYHIVIPISDRSKNVTFPEAQFKSSKRSKRASIDIIYPQILVVIDYDYFVKLGKDISTALPYLLNFWNGVDLMYRRLEHPKFRLNIAGFVFAKDKDALEYMSKNKWTDAQLDVSTALDSMGPFMYTISDTIPFEIYDVAVTMTGFGLCDKNNGKIICKTEGLTMKDGACSFYESHKTMMASSIVRDDAGYGGIQTAAHELGHSFGADHDDREHCIDGNGIHIMGTHKHGGEKSSEWSDCSLKDFEEFLSKEDSACLKNKPISGSGLPRNLPGKFMNADQQCQARGFPRAFYPDENVEIICETLSCFVSEIIDPKKGILTKFQSTGAAADGTACSKDKICVYNKCRFEKL